MNQNDILSDSLKPLGLTHRHFGGEKDCQAWVDLNNICDRADDVDNVDRVEQMRLWVDHIQPSDTLLIETADGRLVARGLASEEKKHDGEWLYQLEGRVHPQWRQQGIGRTLLRWLEGRSREMADLHAEERGDAPAAFFVFTRDQIVGKTALLVSEGYLPVRYGYLLARDLRLPIPEAPLPPGIEIRPMRPEQTRQAWEAWRETMRDHYDFSEANWTDAYYEGFIAYPELDFTLWQVAWQGDEVVGGCEIIVSEEEDAALGVKRGWFDLVGIRRPWRRQGIAKATIAAGLRALQRIGKDEAMLGVDGENPHGAFPLYESLGFVIRKRTTNYKKYFLTP